MTKNLTPRMEEEIITTSDLSQMKGKYLAENLYQRWTEDFIDESTQEVVTLDRHALLFEKGKYIDHDLLTQINFYLQTQDISEVKVCNVQRTAFKENRRPSLWVATAEIDIKKKHFYLYAKSAEMAHNITADYIEQCFSGGFSIVGVKELPFMNIVAFSKEGVSENEPKWYEIQLKITYTDPDEPWHNSSFIVKATDAEEAKALSEVFFNEYLNGGKHEFTSRLLSAKNINIEAVISHEFCKKYLKNE